MLLYLFLFSDSEPAFKIAIVKNCKLLYTMLLAHSFAEKLGSDNEQVHFTCTTTGRTSVRVYWFKDGISLNTSGEKYVLSRTQHRMTVLSIIARDEGNYTCSYSTASGVRISAAGCLLVYGKCLPLTRASRAQQRHKQQR